MTYGVCWKFAEYFNQSFVHLRRLAFEESATTSTEEGVTCTHQKIRQVLGSGIVPVPIVINA